MPDKKRQQRRRKSKKPKVKVDFFNVIPEEVIVNNLLPHLQGNDLLRLRRVSKKARDAVDDYMGLRKIKLESECSVKLRHIVPMGREDYESFDNTKDINWTGRGDPKVGGALSALITLKESKAKGTLAYMLNLGYLIPICRVYLNSCCMPDLWKNPQMPEFMGMYANQITHLRLNRIELPLGPEARKGFLLKFTSLQCLEAREISTTEDTSFHELGACDLIPYTLQNLKRLNIHRFLTPKLSPRSNNQAVVRGYYQRYCRFIKACCSSDSLEYINFPSQILVQVIENNKTTTTVAFMNQDYLEIASKVLEGRSNKFFLPNRSSLEFDLKNFWLPGPSRETLLEFLRFGNICRRNFVNLLNLDQTLLRCLARLAAQPGTVSDFGKILGDCVVSVRNLHALETHATLPKLERILITRTSLCSMRCFSPFSRAPWAKLTTIHMTVDSDTLGESGWQNAESPPQHTVRLFDFLFRGIVRKSLAELKMKFNAEENTHLVVPIPLCPNVQDVIASCENLKILAIDSWPGENNELSQLWTGLKKLEEVCLISCKMLDITAFTGNDTKNVSFLSLKGLKKMTLSCIENMPCINDDLISIVIRNLSLKELYLKCDKPIGNITMAGIETLLDGKFSKSVERFPLVGCLKLDKVTDGDLKRMEKKFRSYNLQDDMNF